jgi:actin-related protein
MEEKGVTGAIIEALKFTDESTRHNYLENIIVSGGNTRFPGFCSRLYEEIKKNSFCWIKPRIYAVK